jgi:hypothetical protein
MARSSVAQFAAQLRAFSKKVEKRYRRVVGELAKRLHRKIVRRTPVRLTGRHRASWNLSLIVPDFTPLDASVKLTAREATDVARETESRLAGLDPLRHTIHIANGLPTINALEHGSSRKAPRGMVLLSVREVIAEGPRPLEKEEAA